MKKKTKTGNPVDELSQNDLIEYERMREFAIKDFRKFRESYETELLKHSDMGDHEQI